MNTSWLRVVTLVLLVVLCGATDSRSGEDSRTRELQQEWRNVQFNKDRGVIKGWWRDLAPEDLERYLKAGVEVNVRGRKGWTPLHSGARYNASSDVVSLLLQAGANLHAKTRSGDTPLHWAAADNPNPRVVQALINAGADVNRRDRFGWTALHTAAESSSEPEVIALLLNAGAAKKKRAYFALFSPKFLLKRNSNMADDGKARALELLSAGSDGG